MKTQIYDITKTFEENVTYGPYWDEKLPKFTKQKLKYSFLGHKLNSRFGIAACPLTCNSRYVSLMSHLGYDLLTYKTVRNYEWHGNTFPHWAFIDVDQPISIQEHGQKTYDASWNQFPKQDVSMVNSFGIHSIKPKYWQEDVNITIKKLQRGQLLILSLLPANPLGGSLIKNISDLTHYALETDASVFEVNFACPNTDGSKGLIYEDLALTVKISEIMKKILGNKLLLAKVGFYRDQTLLREYLKRTKGAISGISSMNTSSGKILGKNTKKEFFSGRPIAGVSGAAIRNIAKEQVKNIVAYRNELDLKDFVVIGIGGVTKPQHISQYLDIGVDAVQSAVGAWADPYLAYKYKKSL